MPRPSSICTSLMEPSVVTVTLRVSPRVKIALSGAGQNANFAPDGAYVGQATPVCADTLIEDFTAHDLFVKVIQRVRHFVQTARKLLRKVLRGSPSG